MSTVLVTLLVACSVHLGTIPGGGAWSVAEVRAPVAEPEIDDWVHEAVVTALSARHALDPAGPALRVTVAEASWSPSRRAGETLLYEARLTLRVEAGERVVTRSRTWTVVDPGTAAAGRALREDTFRVLARQAAEDAVTWLVTAG